MAYHWAHINDSVIRTFDTDHLLFSPDAMNTSSTDNYPQVLRGMADGGVNAFECAFNNMTAGSIGTSLNSYIKSYNICGKPFIPFIITQASQDSPLKKYTYTGTDENWPTQNIRGHQYRVNTSGMANAKGQDGLNFIVGLGFWRLYDNFNEASVGYGGNYSLLTVM